MSHWGIPPENFPRVVMLQEINISNRHKKYIVRKGEAFLVVVLDNKIYITLDGGCGGVDRRAGVGVREVRSDK